jgi:hypothetical protein
MRSMLQLLGGVAVAGAVAAGTTAFTNSGVTMPGAVFIGGSASITPVGAPITSVVATYASSNTQISQFDVTFTGGASSTAVGKTVTLAVTDGTATWGSASTGFTCTTVNASGVSACTPASTYTPGSITNLTITVV